MALGIAAAMLGAPPMGRRVRSTGDADVDRSLDRALAIREQTRRDAERLAAAQAKRARKAEKRRATPARPTEDADAR